MPDIDIKKLRKILETEVSSDTVRALYSDAFATGCFLHQNGNKKAGQKLCLTVFSALGFKGRKTFFNNILNTLDGNEYIYASAIWAHAEINSLFENSRLG